MKGKLRMAMAMGHEPIYHPWQERRKSQAVEASRKGEVAGFRKTRDKKHMWRAATSGVTGPSKNFKFQLLVRRAGEPL